MEQRIIKQPIVLKTSPKNGVVNAFKQNGAIIFLTVCFVLGVLTGSLIFKYNGGDKNFYATEFSQYFAELKTGFAGVFINSVLKVLPFVAAIFLSGTCMAGGILVPIITLLGGVSFGLICSYAYSNYLLNGIVFNLLLVCPAAVIFALAVILSAREALGFSLGLARLAFPSKTRAQIQIENDFKIYCTRQLFITLFFLASAVVRTLLSVSFISYFKF